MGNQSNFVSVLMSDGNVVRRERGREVADALLEAPAKRAKKKRGNGVSLDCHLSGFFIDRAQTLPEKTLSSDLELRFWWSTNGKAEFLKGAVFEHQRAKVVSPACPCLRLL